ncbi:MAG: YerC/YecD family TrpR-related protein [Patescibacteria group bacterium]
MQIVIGSYLQSSEGGEFELELKLRLKNILMINSRGLMRRWKYGFKDMQKLENYEEILKFFTDLLTDNELRMLAQRWHIARELVSTNDSKVAIAERVDTSTTTVCTVANNLYLGVGGMRELLRKCVMTPEEEKLLEERKKAMERRRGGSYNYAKGHFQ